MQVRFTLGLAAALAVAVAGPILVYYTYPTTAEVYIETFYAEHVRRPGFVAGVWGCASMSARGFEAQGVFMLMHGHMGYLVLAGSRVVLVALPGCWVSEQGRALSGEELATLLNGRKVEVEGELYTMMHGPVILPAKVVVEGDTFARKDWSLCQRYSERGDPMHGPMRGGVGGCCG
ncbi:MAG: hypothetical protein ABWW70_00665 [Thermoproteota archaeon]